MRRTCFKTDKITEVHPICKYCPDYIECLDYAKKKKVSVCAKCGRIGIFATGLCCGCYKRKNK